MHHTKTKGDLGLVKVITKLTEKQFVVGVLLTEHAAYDLLAEKEGICYRIQVKYCSSVGKYIQVGMASSWADKNGNHMKTFDPSKLDVILIYCPDTDKCYWVPTDKIKGKYRFNLALTKSKNNGVRQHMAEDFEF